MPNYDYGCVKCKLIREVFHSIDDKSDVLCEECTSRMERIYITPPAMAMGRVLELDRARDASFKRIDMKQDLRENYGVEELKPVPNAEGKGYEAAYQDIKDRGSFVKEKMKNTKQYNKEKVLKKNKERKAKIEGKIIEERKRVVIEKRKEMSFEARKLTVTTKEK